MRARFGHGDQGYDHGVTNGTRIRVADDHGVRTAHLDGRLDVYSAAVLAPRVLAGLPNDAAQLVVDLSRVVAMDSAGVSALVRLNEQARARALGMHARLGRDCRLNPTVRSVLQRVVPCDEG